MKTDYLSTLSRPSRYLGQEYNSVHKDWHSTNFRLALVFPDLYEIGMSHHGLQIIYHLLNQQKDFIAERCYAPTPEAEELLYQKKAPLTTLESERPLIDFDAIGFTLPYELCYTNILTVLNCAGIPFYNKERSEEYPLIIGGGSCALNPEPVADFFDAILLGDGEEAMIEVANTLVQCKKQKNCKEEKLQQLAEIEGIYVPQHFTPHYEGNRISSISCRYGNGSVRRRIVANLNDTNHLHHPLVPNAKIVHDRLGIEIARGCTRGCRFCQAGITYRPVREREPDQLLKLVETALANSGFEELALLSLSTGDYSCIAEILAPLMDKLTKKYVSVSMPSMRVGTLTPEMMEQIKRVRKTGFTLAPEAGSERMRRVINKGITEEDLLAASSDAFRLGWKLIKCYFMIGLPTETDQDILAIAQLAKAVSATAAQPKTTSEQGHKKSGRGQVTVSVGTFVPKPHTPFQWQRQISIEESFRRIHLLKKSLPQKGNTLKYHDPKVSWLEGVFSRGDRKLSHLIEAAWQNGARLDGWAEHFHLEKWTTAAEKIGLDMEEYLRERSFDEILPWSHLDSRISNDFLRSEYEKALVEGYTPDCRYHACQKCGLCDFKEIAPVVCKKQSKKEQCPLPEECVSSKQEQQHFKYMVHYSRFGKICYLGHLEILQLIFRTLRRAQIPLHYSQGFNPSPKVSFSPALPVGTESKAEFFIMDISKPLLSLSATITAINESLPEGLRITAIELNSKMPETILSSYKVTLPQPLNQAQQKHLTEFNSADHYFLTRVRKNKIKEIDIRPIIKTLSVSGGKELKKTVISLSIISSSSSTSVKPSEALLNIMGLTENEVNQLSICKESWEDLS